MAKKTEEAEKPMKKAKAFRIVIGELGVDANLEDILAVMKERYGLEMDKNMASTYRSTYKKGLSESAVLPKSSSKRKESPNDAIEFMKTIREWEAKLSPGTMQDLLKILHPS